MKISLHYYRIFQMLFLMALPLFSVQIGYAQNTKVTLIQLNPNFGQPVRLKENAATIAIGDPNIIDVVTVEPNLLMVTGQQKGSTSLTVIGKSGAIYQYRAQVVTDISQLSQVIGSLEPRVTVHDINGKVVLKGEVETGAALVRVLTVADRFMGGKGDKPHFDVVSDQGGVLAGNISEDVGQFVSEAFINVNNVAGAGRGGQGGGRGGIGGGQGGGQGGGRGGIGGGQGGGQGKANLAQNIARASVISFADGQIISMIKVLNQPKVEIQMRIVEVDRAKTDEFGIDWRLDGNNVTIGSFAGDVTSSLPPPNNTNAVSSGSANLIGFFQPGKYTLSTFVRALEEKGATTTLSEPLLTALSGEASQFLVGGSVPIPTQTQAASINTVATATNVQFVNFGLGITVRPTVLENGKINIVLNQSISELDFGSAIQILGTQVPGFKQKTISTVTESESGETWAVAGLLTEEDRKRLQSVPWISKVPILGELFKNRNDSISRNEMIILVNARVIDKPNTTTTNFNGLGDLAPSGQIMNEEFNNIDEENEIIYQELNSPQLSKPIVKESINNKAPAKTVPLSDPNKNLHEELKQELNSKSKKKLGNLAYSPKNFNDQPIRLINLKQKIVEQSVPIAATANIVNTSPLQHEVIEKKEVTSNELNIDEIPNLLTNLPNVGQAIEIVNADSIDHISTDIDNLSSTTHIYSMPVAPSLERTADEVNFKTSEQRNLQHEKLFATQSQTNFAENNTQNEDLQHHIHTDINENYRKKLALNDQPIVNHTIKNLRGASIEILDIPVSESNKPTNPLNAQHDFKSKIAVIEKIDPKAITNQQLSKVEVLYFLAGKEKQQYLEKNLLLSNPSIDAKNYKVAVCAIDGDMNQLVKFIVDKDSIKEIYSGAIAYVETKKDYSKYAVDYLVENKNVLEEGIEQ